MADSPPAAADRRHTIRTVSVGTVWRILRYPFILLSVSIVPRAMGDAVYGQYAFFMSVYLILDILTDIGTTQAFGRFVPEAISSGDRPGARRLLHGYLYYAMLVAAVLIAGVLLTPVVRRFDSFPAGWFVILAALILFTKIEGILFGFIYGLNRIGQFSAKEAMRSAFTFLFVYGLYTAFGLTGALWGLVLNEVVLSAFALAWTRADLFARPDPIRFRAFKPYLAFGIRFYIPLFLFGMMQRTGNVFIQWISGASEQVAYFDIANQFLLLTATFLGLILSTLLPSLAILYTQSRHDTIDRYHRFAMTYCGVAVFLAYNALGWLGRDAIALVMGPDFAAVFPNALLIVLAMFPNLIAYVGMNYSLLAKEPGVYTRGVLAGLAVMVLGFLLLIPRWHALGATAATVLGYATLALVFVLRYRREMFTVLRPFAWVAALGLCFTPLYRFHFSLPLSILLYCCTSLAYLAILFAFRLIVWADALRVLDAFRGAKKGPTDPPAGEGP